MSGYHHFDNEIQNRCSKADETYNVSTKDARIANSSSVSNSERPKRCAHPTWKITPIASLKFQRDVIATAPAPRPNAWADLLARQEARQVQSESYTEKSHAPADENSDASAIAHDSLEELGTLHAEHEARQEELLNLSRTAPSTGHRESETTNPSFSGEPLPTEDETQLTKRSKARRERQNLHLSASRVLNPGPGISADRPETSASDNVAPHTEMKLIADEVQSALANTARNAQVQRGNSEDAPNRSNELTSGVGVTPEIPTSVSLDQGLNDFELVGR